MSIPQRAGKPRKRDESGQATILIASMVVTFILFFSFVVNIGMLVNAKINLQNAADLAAYSGAATQGRHLSQISYLNYEMRRHYKKFLFRYYVIGNMAQKGFPRTAGASNPMIWSPDGNPNNNFNVPAVCLIFKAADNYCQVSNLIGITIPAPGAIPDAIQDTLIAQLKGLEALRQANCGNIGSTNLQALYLWLYNTDPTLQSLTQGGVGNITGNQLAILKIIQGVADGLGLVPKELLLKQRILTLESYVNTPASSGVTKGTADQMNADPNNPARERTVNAFYSAYYTLGNHTFAPETITLDEIPPQPVDPQEGPYLKLQPIAINFDSYFEDLQIPQAGGIAAGPNGIATPPNSSAPVGTVPTISQNCKPTLIPISLKQVPIGVYKDTQTLTYYAVRVRATAQTLFSPFINGSLQLKAYAAAQPYGSRIGPQITDAEQQGLLWRQGTANPNFSSGNNILADVSSNQIPNLPIGAQDSADSGAGFDNQATVGALFTELKTLNSNNNNNASGIALTDLQNAYMAAMAPNPWEITRYNIPSDSTGDNYAKFFDQASLYDFWAPIATPQAMGSIDQTLQGALTQMFTGPLAEGSNAGNTSVQKPTQQTDALKTALSTGLLNYVQQMQNPNTTSTELLFSGSQTIYDTASVARITNPLTQRPVQGLPNPPTIDLPQSIMVSDPSALRTSWNQTRGSSPPRVGYSVKFIAFKHLRNMTADIVVDSTGTNHPANVPQPDTEAAADLAVLQH